MRQKRPHAMTWHELMQELVTGVVFALIDEGAVQLPKRLRQLDAELRRRDRNETDHRCYCAQCWVDPFPDDS